MKTQSDRTQALIHLRPSSKRNLLIVALAGLALAVLAWGLARPAANGTAASAGRSAASDLRLTDFQGETFTLGRYRGRPLVVNFWASWCPSCAAEMPAFERVYQRLDGEIAFVGINARDSRARAEELARSTGVTYRLAEDPRGKAFTAFGVTGMPTTVLLDENGNVADVVVGQLSEGQLLSLIEQRLGMTV